MNDTKLAHWHIDPTYRGTNLPIKDMIKEFQQAQSMKADVAFDVDGTTYHMRIDSYNNNKHIIIELAEVCSALEENNGSE